MIGAICNGMKITRRAVLMGWVGMACLVTAACATGHPIHYYTIDPPPTTGAVSAKPRGLVLLVGRFATPETLEDGRIRYRTGSNEVGAYEYHRWTVGPGLMVRDLLIQTLRRSGKYRQVQESSSAAAGDYLIRGRLYDFSEVDRPGLRTRISLQLELVDRKNGLVVWDHYYNRDERVDGKAIKDVVASLDRNLQQVITEAASGVEGFLSNRS
jgi:ABC-type uncharacterized transport system auxiliary subunit